MENCKQFDINSTKLKRRAGVLERYKSVNTYLKNKGRHWMVLDEECYGQTSIFNIIAVLQAKKMASKTRMDVS